MEQPEELDYQIYREFEIVSKIGKGTYGVVYKAIAKQNKKMVAIKKIIDAFQNLIDAKRTYRQLNYLLQIEHPAIVRLEYLLPMGRRDKPQQLSTTRLTPPPTDIRGYNTDKLAQPSSPQQMHVYAVFEFVETDLRRALKQCSELQPIQRKFISYQLLHGIAYLHRSGLIHRDIKPENLLLNCDKLQLKICDFGMARLHSSVTGNEGVLTEYVASRWYRPPEALLGINTCEPAIDLWSIGCVLAELALNAPIFPGKSTLDQLELIFRAIGMVSSAQIDKLASEQSRYVLQNFSFSRKAKFRPLQDTLSMCSNAEIDLIMRLLSFDPQERISAEEALNHEYFDQVRDISPELEAYRHLKADVEDLSVNPVNDKGQKVNLGVDHYRSFIEELEKFTDRSTNRSAPLHKARGVLKEAFNAVNHHETDKEDNKEKSTKESNFVTENKHHFLSKTHDNLNKVNETSHRSERQSKMGKNKRSFSKNALGKKKVIEIGKQIKSKPKLDKTSAKGRSKTSETGKKPVKRNQEKDIFALAREAPSKTVKKMIMSIHGQQPDKKVKKMMGMNSLHSYKSASRMTGNASMVSNYSKASSTHSRSKERVISGSKSKPRQMQLSSKEEAVRRMGKKPPAAGRSGLVKCKSAALANLFKR